MVLKWSTVVRSVYIPTYRVSSFVNDPKLGGRVPTKSLLLRRLWQEGAVTRGVCRVQSVLKMMVYTYIESITTTYRSVSFVIDPKLEGIVPANFR
jgi:hypothetical protein